MSARPRIIQSESRRATRAEVRAIVSATEPRFYYSDETDLSRFGLPFVEAAARPTPGEGERVVAGPDEEYAPGKWRETWVVEPVPVVIPDTISRAQGKAVLISQGMWAGVLAYVEAIQDPTEKALAEVALNDTQEWKRSSPFLNAAASALGLSSADMDGLFLAAAQVNF